MAKIKVTYHNLNGDAPTVTQYGVEFEDGKTVTIDTDELRAASLALHKWRNNPWFEVSGGDEIKHEPPKPKEVDPRELDPEEVEHAELMKADADARKKQAEQMKANVKTPDTNVKTPQHTQKDWRK